MSIENKAINDITKFTSTYNKDISIENVLNEINIYLINFFKRMSNINLKEEIFEKKVFEKIALTLLINLNHGLLHIIVDTDDLDVNRLNIAYYRYLDIISEYLNNLKNEMELSVNDITFLSKDNTDYVHLLSLYGIPYININ